MNTESNVHQLPQDPKREYLSVREVAEITGLGLTTIRKAIYEGNLKARKIGKKVVVKRGDMESWIEDAPSAAGEPV